MVTFRSSEQLGAVKGDGAVLQPEVEVGRPVLAVVMRLHDLGVLAERRREEVDGEGVLEHGAPDVVGPLGVQLAGVEPAARVERPRRQDRHAATLLKQ